VENRWETLERARRDFIAITEHRGDIFDAIDVVLRTLDEGELRVLQLAALYGPGYFGIELVRATCSEIAAHVLADIVAALCDRCLLSRKSNSRYSLHELVAAAVLTYVEEDGRAQHLGSIAVAMTGILSKANQDMDWRGVRDDLPHYRAVADGFSTPSVSDKTRTSIDAEVELELELGTYLSEQGNVEEAHTRLARAITRVDSAGRSARLDYTKAVAMRRLAGVLRQQDHGSDALRYASAALRMARGTLQCSDPALADFYNVVGYVLKWQGRYGRAMPYYRRALAIFESGHGRWHSSVAMCLNNIGTLYQAMGQLDASRTSILEALTIDASIHGEDHPKAAILQNNVGRVLTQLGQPWHAIAFHRKAYSTYKRRHGAGHPDTAATMLLIADALCLVGTPASLQKAQSMARDADVALSPLFDETHGLRQRANYICTKCGDAGA